MTVSYALSMTGQEGGFREAVARFSAEVDAAVTRARRAAADAKAQTAEFRAGTQDLVSRVKEGRAGTVAEPPDEDDDVLDDWGAEPDVTQPSDDDEYFSQQRILVRGSEEPYRPGEE